MGSVNTDSPDLVKTIAAIIIPVSVQMARLLSEYVLDSTKTMTIPFAGPLGIVRAASDGNETQ
jgi:hypothetical protein